MTADDKKRGRELAEILLAEANGATIQWSTLPGADMWSDVLYSVMNEISEDYGSWVRDELFFRVKPEPEKVQLCTLCGSIDGNSSRHTHPASCPGKVYLFYVDDAISVT